MRAALACLVVLALAPHAAAQAQMTASLSAQPPDAGIVPLQGIARVPLILRVTCPPHGLGPDGVTATFQILRAPSWARAKLDPAEVRIEGADCLAREATATTTVEVQVTEAAPAYAAQVIEVEAVVEAPLANPAHAMTGFPVYADYYTVLDVIRPRDVLRPDEVGVARVDLKLANLGNGPTRVLFDVGDRAEDIRIAPPLPVVLGARGEPGSTATVQLTAIRLTPGEHASPFSVRLTPSYALDPSRAGDATELSFQVLPAPWMEDQVDTLDALQGAARDRREAPFGALLLVGTALVLAAKTRRT